MCSTPISSRAASTAEAGSDINYRKAVGGGEVGVNTKACWDCWDTMCPVDLLCSEFVEPVAGERSDVRRRAGRPSVLEPRTTSVCVPRVHGFYTGGGPFTGSCRLTARVGDLPCLYR